MLADARHFQQARGRPVQHVERIQPEVINDASRGHRADALHQPAAEIAPDRLNRRRADLRDRFRFELPPETRVGGPFALKPQAFAWLHLGHRADDRHQIFAA